MAKGSVSLSERNEEVIAFVTLESATAQELVLTFSVVAWFYR